MQNQHPPEDVQGPRRKANSMIEPTEKLEDRMVNFKISENENNTDRKDVSTASGSRKPPKLSRNRRARSLYGVSPCCQFGPKGTILDNSSSFLTIPDPGSQKLKWCKAPLTVLVVKKMYDDSVLSAFKKLVNWLVEFKNMVVYIENKYLDESYLLSQDQQFGELRPKLQTFEDGVDDLTGKIDMIICLGGDGTLLYASSFFQTNVPPVIAFNMGSLGFLTPFSFDNFKEQVTNVLEGHADLTLRYRLKCVVCKQGSETQKVPHIKHIDHSNSREHYLVLNEVVVDRAQSPYLSNVDLFIEGRLVTSVQGDGLIISTPTGSTAYAVSAGASMVHPNVPAIILCPICPHSLSFRPIIVPAGVEIKIMVAPNARSSVWLSFDGRNRQELLQGDCLRITTAQYPVPSVCARDQIDDWFAGLAQCLHWNVRQQQKPLPTTVSTTSLDSVDLSN